MKNTIEVKSIIESLKWIVIFLTFANIFLNLSSYGLTEVQYYAVELIIFFIFLGFNNRLVYDTNKHKLSVWFTLKFFNVSLCKFKRLSIEGKQIEDIRIKSLNKLTTINIHYTSDDNVPSTYSFICFLQNKTTQTIAKSVIPSKQRVESEIETKHRNKDDSFLTMDTFMSIFRYHSLFSQETAKTKFSIAGFCMPIPKAKKKTIKATVLFFVLLTIVLGLTSQNISVVGVLSIVTYLSYWVSRAFVCNEYYFISTSPLSAITVSPDKLYLPALLFNDRKAREVTKKDLDSINANWNHNHTSINNQIVSTSAKAYVLSIVFNTKQQVTIPTTNFSIDGEALLYSLLKYGYPVTLNKTSKAVYPIKKHIFIMLILFISYMTISYIIK